MLCGQYGEGAVHLRSARDQGVSSMSYSVGYRQGLGSLRKTRQLFHKCRVGDARSR